MLYATLKLLHVLSIVVWVGGMVFAGFFLRPAALQLPPPQRIPLMHAALQRFFAAVVVAVLVVLVDWRLDDRPARPKTRCRPVWASTCRWTGPSCPRWVC